jgi:hypothetical protein
VWTACCHRNVGRHNEHNERDSRHVSSLVLARLRAMQRAVRLMRAKFTQYEQLHTLPINYFNHLKSASNYHLL